MRAADLVLLVVDVTTGITEEDARVARVLQHGDVPVMRRRQQGRRRATARSTSTSSCGSASASRGRCRRSTAGCRASCSTRSSPRCPSRPRTRCRPHDADRARRHLLGRDRRPPERRQVDAVQPPGGGGAVGRARPARHDPRRDRHRGRDRRRPAALRRHRRAAAQEPDRRADASTTASCARSRRSTAPTPRCSSSTRPKA